MLRRPIALLVCLAFLLNLPGCTSPQTVDIAPEMLEELEYEWIEGVTTVSGEVIEFDPVTKAGTWSGKYPRGAYAEVRNDSLFGTVNGQSRIIPLADVKHMWVKQSKFDPLATMISVAAGALVLSFVFLAIAVSSWDNSSSGGSCPFVYSWDGERFVFDAEPFAGAISKGLERDDTAELESLKAVDGEYRLLLANEMVESDHTNLMELWIVDHPPGTRVAADAEGGMHAFVEPMRLLEARDAEGRDLRLWLESADRRLWEPLPQAGSDPVRQEIVMRFPRPAGADHVRLIADVRTSFWGALMIGEMLALRGHQLPSFYALLDNIPAARESLQAWNLREELYILQLEVEERDGWRVRGHLPGEALAPETVVVPLDIHGVDGDDLRIRIRPPIGFWALNSFAVDYGPEPPLRVRVVPPTEARDRAGNNVLPTLLESDDSYFVMPKQGDGAHLVFPAPPPVEKQDRTVFLHSRGYYVLHLPIQDDPDLPMLEQISRVPDGAARFATERFLQWQAEAKARSLTHAPGATR